MEIEERTATFVLFGVTGSGKSTLANAAIGRLDRFKEGKGIFSETTQVSGEMGMFDEYPVLAIDTPGLLDSSGRDQEHLNRVTGFIKDHTGVKSFVIVINFKDKRIDQSINKLFQIIEQMYTGKEWYKHIVIVWSFFEGKLSEQKKERMKQKYEGIKKTIKKVVPRISETELNSVQQYFLSNREAKIENTESRKKLREMIEWISTLPSINETLGIINDVDNDVMKEENETKREIVIDTTDGNVRTIVTALFQRKKQILYSGKLLYTDYEEVEGSRLEEKRFLIEPPPDMIPEDAEETKILGERKVVDSTVYGGRKFLGLFGPRSRSEKGRIMQKKLITKKRRYKKVYSGGKTEQTPWEVISTTELDEVIGTFEDGIEQRLIGAEEMKSIVGLGQSLFSFF